MIRFLDDQGSEQFERTNTLTLVKDERIDVTRPEVLATEIQLDDLPPEPEVLSATPPNIRLLPGNLVLSNTESEGIPLYGYEWSYELSRPLRKKGDFIQYRYVVEITGSDTRAFTKDGDFFTIDCRPVFSETSWTIIAPPDYRVEVLTCYKEDYDGRQSEVDESQWPELGVNGASIKWETAHILGMKYVCNYRLVET